MQNLAENLTDGVIAYIRQQLFEAKTLSPGDKINERELSRILNISRAPIREAFRELEEQGFVTSVKYKGWFVPDFSEEDALEINNVRTLLEGHLFEVAIRKESYTEEDIPAIEALNEDLAELEREEADRPGKVYQFLQKEMEFHLALYALAKNHCLLTQKLLKNLTYQIRLSLSYTDNLHKQDFMKYSVEVHRLMLRYLREKNLEGFQGIISRRLDRNKNIQDILDSSEK